MRHFILYKTTNLVNGKIYIGIHETNNLDDGYLGSGVMFRKALKRYGKKNFKREILEYCSSFEELLEKERFLVNEDWVKNENNYNLKTGGQSIGRLCETSRNKISETLKRKYTNGEIQYHGKPNIPTEELKKQISNTLKNKYSKQKHHLKGRAPWNKGIKGVQVAWNKGIKSGPMSEECKKLISKKHKVNRKNNPNSNFEQSEKLKVFYKTNVHPTKGMEPWNKNIKMKKTECPHCKKMVDLGNGRRWHFDNCKLKMNN